jgi:hypothetical protein
VINPSDQSQCDQTFGDYLLKGEDFFMLREGKNGEELIKGRKVKKGGRKGNKKTSDYK